MVVTMPGAEEAEEEFVNCVENTHDFEKSKRRRSVFRCENVEPEDPIS